MCKGGGRTDIHISLSRVPREVFSSVSLKLYKCSDAQHSISTQIPFLLLFPPYLNRQINKHQDCTSDKQQVFRTTHCCRVKNVSYKHDGKCLVSTVQCCRVLLRSLLVIRQYDPRSQILFWHRGLWQRD